MMMLMTQRRQLMMMMDQMKYLAGHHYKLSCLSDFVVDFVVEEMMLKYRRMCPGELSPYFPGV